MLEVTIGKEGLRRTWQEEFPETTECVHCQGESRIGFTVFEHPAGVSLVQDRRFVCDLHPNDPGGEGYWLHDCVAVAVYFCRECLEATALYNQA